MIKIISGYQQFRKEKCHSWNILPRLHKGKIRVCLDMKWRIKHQIFPQCQSGDIKSEGQGIDLKMKDKIAESVQLAYAVII